MTHPLFKKTVSALVLLLLLSVTCFTLTSIQPGNPYIDRLNPNMSPEAFEAQLIALGYYDSVPVKYLKWLKHTLQLDFGYSIKKNTPIGPLVLNRLGNTLKLMGFAYVLSLLIGIPAGIWMSTKQNTRLYRVLDKWNQFLLALPSFLVGLLLIKCFAATLKWLPVSGMYSLTLSEDASFSIRFWDQAKHMAMPVTTLLFMHVPMLMRFTCQQMEQLYRAPFKKVLVAKGLSQKKIIWHHCFKNTWVPLLALISTQFPIVLSGALITESLFQYPGMGMLAFESAMSRDFPVVMALLLVNGAFVILINLIAEALYPLMDPRIQTGGAHA